MAANVSISYLFNLLAAEVCLQYQGEVSRFHAAHHCCLECFGFSGSKRRGVSSPLLLYALRVNPPRGILSAFRRHVVLRFNSDASEAFSIGHNALIRRGNEFHSSQISSS